MCGRGLKLDCAIDQLGKAGVAYQLDARLRTDHRQHGQVRRVDRTPGIVLRFDLQDLGGLVAVDADVPAAAGVDQDLVAAGRVVSRPSAVV